MSAPVEPGTWTYTRNPENTRWIIDSAPSHAVACTAGYACDSEDIARLIASAPTLRDALQVANGNMMNVIVGLGAGDSKAKAIADLKAAMGRITAALASAEGV